MEYKKWSWKAGLLITLAAVGLSACGGASGGKSSDYPSKPLVVVAPSGAGGGWDKTARSLTKVLAEAKLVDQTMTVENKPGGGGAVFLADYVSQDKNNPYKLFVSSPPILINNLKKEGNSPYGYRDTTPLAQLTKDFGAIVVKADSKYADIAALMNDLKANPTKITIAGGSSPGSMDHLISVLPAFKFGIDPKSVKYVSYDGGGEAIAALLGNNADVIGTDISSASEYLKAGKVRVLAVTSAERLGGDFANVPTLKESGIDAEFTIWRGVFGPKGMKDNEKAYWENTLKSLNDSEAWKTELKANAWEPEFKSGEDFGKFLADQEVLIQDLLTALGMQK